MKLIGAILIAVGIAFLIFLAYYLLKESNKPKSPIPDDKGVKVIFVTPTD